MPQTLHLENYLVSFQKFPLYYEGDGNLFLDVNHP